MQQPSFNDVIVEWDIENINHIIDNCLVSPEYELGNGTWRLVLQTNRAESGYIQCGLQNAPASPGLRDITVLFSFELVDRDHKVFARMTPRFGDFPPDNDVTYDFFKRPRIFDYVRMTVRCTIKRLAEDHHLSPMTLSAVTELLGHRVSFDVEFSMDRVQLKRMVWLKRPSGEGSVEEKLIVVITIRRFEDSITMSMSNATEYDKFSVTICTSLLDMEGRAFLSSGKRVNYFRTLNQSWDFLKLNPKEGLGNTENIPKDANLRLYVHFEMEFHLGEKIHWQEKYPVSKRHIPGCLESSLGDALIRMYESKKYCDWKISVDPNQPPIHVHKCILANRSSYFRAMLERDMLERSSEQISLKDVDLMTVDLLLRFLYSNKVLFKDDAGKEMDYRMVCEIYRAANMYLMPEVQDSCSEFLQLHVSKHNVLFLRRFAKLYQDVALKNMADKCIVQRQRQGSQPTVNLGKDDDLWQ